MVDKDAHGLGVLNEPTCRRLLEIERVGRLGLSVDSLPVILPVNYVVHNSAIVFRSEDGVKVRAARRRSVACFEVDGFDRFEHSGWSVLATGRLSLIPDARAEDYRELPVEPWGLSGESHFIELSIELLSGRCIIRATEENHPLAV